VIYPIVMTSFLERSMPPLHLELSALDATGQAALIRQGEITPLQAVEAAIERIEQLNPRINAVVTKLYDKAIVLARSPRLPDGPFRGVPLLLKDYLCESAGDPYYAGMKFLRDLGWRSDADTFLAAKFREAGFVFLGKTNLPELAGGPHSGTAAFGLTRNPWELSKTPGGSSSGSAAAVAAGMVAVAHGNDGTGSIRIPASCCGLVGLKPSRGRISHGPARNEGVTGNIVEFVLTRTLRDAAAILDAVAGPMPGDQVLAPPPQRPFLQELGASPGKLRVGLLIHDPQLDLPVHPACVTAVNETGKQLEALGDHVEYAFPAQLAGITGLGLGLRWISTSALAATLDAWAERTGRQIGPDDVEPETWAAAQEGRTYSAVQLHQAFPRLVIGARGTLSWWQSGFDLLITPTMTQPPIAVGERDREKLRASFGLFTMPFSFTGQPAISLPLHWHEGLPIGVQLVADYGREDLLLRVAAQLEEAMPWAERRPPLALG
jgi:amidase